MNTELSGVILTFVITLLCAIPLGKYIAKLFAGEHVWSDFLAPLEKLIYKISAIDPGEQLDWKANMKAMLKLNAVFFAWAFIVLLIKHPFLNPLQIVGMEASLAFNSAVSFVTNTNLQHNTPETSASYLSQMGVFMFLHFVSAATGLAAAGLLYRSLKQKQNGLIGNFYDLFVKSVTRVFLPISLVLAIALMLNGMPATFNAPKATVTLQGDTVQAATGPVAPLVAIKHLGTNGGGFFGTNSAHPFENPNYFTNMLEVGSQLCIPFALVFAFGFFLKRKKLSYMTFGVMGVFFIIFATANIALEMNGNPILKRKGIDPYGANMEGKETRFGAAASGYFSVATTATSTGAVNSMHDSFMPLSGGVMLTDMMVNAIFGGVGVGMMNYFIYFIIAVFIAGLMVGRTPEFLGKKVEAREIKIAAIVLLLHPLLILVATAIAAHVAAGSPNIGWISNPKYHGFSQMLYEFTSSSANNGSGFEGLGNGPGNSGVGDGTLFWNLATGIVMLIARFLPIIGPVAIGGMLAQKKTIPESAGTLQIDSLTFGIVLFSVIVIVAALSFFPALALGPIAEHFSM